jgi:AcrR family transcriptional regulator
MAVSQVAEVLVRRAAETGSGPLSELGLEELAVLYGTSRSTLLRKIGSRRALDAALAELGAEPAAKPRVADRAIEATAALIARRGVRDVTLDDVAAEAGCSVQAIHAQIGGRDALLVAVFQRYSPMDAMAEVLADPPEELAEAARAIYLAVFDAVLDTPAIPALLAEALSRPHGPLAQFVREGYARSVAGMVRRWLEQQAGAGRIRPMSARLALVVFAGPVAAEVLSLAAAGRRPSRRYRERTASALAASFSAAVRPRLQATTE